MTVALPRTGLARLVATALETAHAPSPASLGLILSGDRELAALNAGHMGQQGPTDVLSFPLLPPDAFPPHVGQAGSQGESAPFALPPGRRLHLGDIVVSVERAAAQAAAGVGGQTGTVRWSAADELRLLVVHGTLHVCGWDHARPEEEAQMRALERRILEEASMSEGSPISDHEQGHGDGHGHTLGWREELEGLRHEAKHYYQHQFDWRGHEPPEGFDGPRFFPPAEEWRLMARLDRDAEDVGEEVTLPTSTGQLRQMSIAGQLVFEADGREQRLTAFRTHAHHGQPASLFVPFRDATSGSETYGAGRYLDLPFDENEDMVEIDFNYAYNPSCVYSPAYDCPFPPPGNRLDVDVRAGERMP